MKIFNWFKRRTKAGSYRLEDLDGRVLHDETDAPVEFGTKGPWKAVRTADGKARLENEQGHVMCDDYDLPVEFDPDSELGQNVAEVPSLADLQTQLEASNAKVEKLTRQVEKLTGTRINPGSSASTTPPGKPMGREAMLDLLSKCGDAGQAAAQRIRSGQLDPEALPMTRALRESAAASTQAAPTRPSALSDERRAELLSQTDAGRKALDRASKGELSIAAVQRQHGLAV